MHFSRPLFEKVREVKSNNNKMDKMGKKEKEGTARVPGKKKRRVFLRKMASWPARPILFLMMKLPVSWVRVWAEVLGMAFWVFGIPWKREAIKNLKFVYKDELSDKELKGIARESMKNIIRMMMEAAIIIRPNHDFSKGVSIEGEEYLKEAIEGDKGVLALGSHVGNFLILISTLSQMGYPISYLFKEPKDEDFKELVYQLNEELKLSPIPIKPRGTALKRSLSVLKRNEILWLALDQDTREGGIGVEFFGVKAATGQGPAVLSMRTGATVLPIHSRRYGWMKHKIIIEPPVELIITGDKDTDIYNNLKNFNTILEKEILSNPQEWWWLHRRWKRAYKFQ